MHGSILAQDSLNIAFGNLSPSDFSQPLPKAFSNSSAVVIADIGKTYFLGESVLLMKQIYTRFIRVKILNKNGFHIADFSFLLSKRGKISFDSIFNLKASTFNLENGHIQETKLDASSVYNETIGKYAVIKKFTMPALKEGSIFDILLTAKLAISEPIKSWDFQNNYPCLWSEYQVTIPPFFQYKIGYQGDSLFDENTSKTIPFVFAVSNINGSGYTVMSGNATQVKWVKKNVPPLENESFVSSMKNYVDRVSFEMEYFQVDKKNLKNEYVKSWSDIGHEYFFDWEIRKSIEANNIWMETDVGKLIAKEKNTNQIIRTIYFFIRDNFTCTNHSGIYPRRSLFEVYKSRSGNVAEINLLLYAMLRQYNIIAYPAILSTSENGRPNFRFPAMEEYNYLICVAEYNNIKTLLDASWPKNSYGEILKNCYSGGARILDDSDPQLINLTPDSIVETKLTNVFITNDEKEGVTGSYAAVYGAGKSYEIREEVRKTTMMDYLKKNPIEIGNGVSIHDENLDSLANCEVPLIRRIDLDFKDFSKSDHVYFTPIIDYDIKANPFNSLNRIYPVEMPCKSDEVYLLSMDIPKGFQVEEMPKSERIKLNENQGLFEYIIQQNQDNIQMQVHFKLNKTVFSREEYSSLREFFGDILKKETEQIVFKKVQ
jgi:hypothetical protein